MSQFSRLLAGFVAAALLVAGAFFLVKRWQDRRTEPVADFRAPAGRSVIKGLARSSSLGNGMAYSLTVDEITFGRRKIGALTINPLREIELTDLQIRIDVPSDTLGVDLRPVLDDLTAHQRLGFVSRIVAHGVDLAFRSAAAQLAITADRLEIGADGAATFHGRFVLRSSAGDRLEAGRARWFPRARRFAAVGPYTLHRDGREKQGRDAYFEIGVDGRFAMQ